MVFGVQKVGFCIAKVWFLFFKRVFFVLQYIVPCPRNTPKWRCDSYHFDTSTPFGSDCKTGAMNRPLRLAVCSLPYICAINEYCGMFAAIYLRYPFRYFYLLYPTFCHVHPVGVGTDLSCPYPRNSTKWHCIFPSLILQYIIPHPRNSTKWHCGFPPLILQYIIPHPRNTHKMALQYIVPRPRTPTKWRCVGAIWQYNIYLFLGIAHLFISY